MPDYLIILVTIPVVLLVTPWAFSGLYKLLSLLNISRLIVRYWQWVDRKLNVK